MCFRRLRLTKKKHIHVAFDRPLMSIENSNEVLSQILNEWENYDNHSDYQLLFPNLIHNICWRYDYVLLRKKK